LGEVIREYAYEKGVNKVFQHSKSGIETVGCYGVIDYGFDIKNADGTTSPAGYVLRQAHERYAGEYSYSLFSEKRSVEIENVLRKYGITSAGAYHSSPVEQINIQGTKSGAVLDFGGFITLDHFEKPARHFYGSKILLDPKSPTFIQPDPEVRIPFKIWGHTVSGKIDPKFDNPWIWSHELANHLRDGSATRVDAERHIRNLLDPIQSRFLAHPLSPEACLNGVLNSLKQQ
jgi:hypothetical protein